MIRSTLPKKVLAGLLLLAFPLLGSCQSLSAWRNLSSRQLPVSSPLPQVGNSCALPPQTLVVGGGGAPSYNEIAIEKNVLYFQRTLQSLRLAPATIWFANGNDGRATIRYLDAQGQERFKPPSIPQIQGPATVDNLRRSLQTVNQQFTQGTGAPLFFYFTGHGSHNEANSRNNAMILWDEQPLSVRQFGTLLDQLDPQLPVAVVMVQCYSGAFANFIYQGGDPKKPVALQSRCGFFATTRDRPSVGCTPEVNEADYQDYSSSFFAGLSGLNRSGQRVASADYNRDGQVSYSEAHAFAKLDEQAEDLPQSTSEVWLQEQVSSFDRRRILGQPIRTWLTVARPEQRYVVESLVQRLKLDPTRSYRANLRRAEGLTEIYFTRLEMELVTIAQEGIVRSSGNTTKLSILDKLLRCEGGFLGKI
jgi:hypothetical protein